jgi:hypothetical protein
MKSDLNEVSKVSAPKSFEFTIAATHPPTKPPTKEYDTVDISK